MKTCKSCIKEIDDMASKCPHCQSFQIWYKSPQLFGLLFPIIFIPLMFYSMGLWFNKEYLGNENLFTVKEISHAPGAFNRLAINYLIENKSNTKWHDVSYELSLFDVKGNLLSVKTGHDYAWLVQPKQSSRLTVEVDTVPEVEKWSFKILDMKSGRF